MPMNIRELTRLTIAFVGESVGNALNIARPI